MKQPVGQLDVWKFGKQLIETQDLDPVYTLMKDNKMLSSPGIRARFYLAYWCFYDIGVASYIADGGSIERFWQRMMIAAVNEFEAPMGGRWPRAAERRHFRGQKCITALDEIYKILNRDPINIFNYLLFNVTSPIPFPVLRKKVLELPQFGPWMAFKIGDMLERVDGIAIDFNGSDVFMFKDPTEGALLVWDSLYHRDDLEQIDRSTKAICRRISNDLIKYFNQEPAYLAPPDKGRTINIQEVETILCKWKSHRHGNYEVGKDTEHCLASLNKWAPYSELARGFDLAVFNQVMRMK